MDGLWIGSVMDMRMEFGMGKSILYARGPKEQCFLYHILAPFYIRYSLPLMILAGIFLLNVL